MVESHTFSAAVRKVGTDGSTLPRHLFTTLTRLCVTLPGGGITRTVYMNTLESVSLCRAPASEGPVGVPARGGGGRGAVVLSATIDARAQGGRRREKPDTEAAAAILVTLRVRGEPELVLGLFTEDDAMGLVRALKLSPRCTAVFHTPSGADVSLPCHELREGSASTARTVGEVGADGLPPRGLSTASTRAGKRESPSPATASPPSPLSTTSASSSRPPSSPAPSVYTVAPAVSAAPASATTTSTSHSEQHRHGVHQPPQHPQQQPPPPSPPSLPVERPLAGNSSFHVDPALLDASRSGSAPDEPSPLESLVPTQARKGRSTHSSSSSSGGGDDSDSRQKSSAGPTYTTRNTPSPPHPHPHHSMEGGPPTAAEMMTTTTPQAPPSAPRAVLHPTSPASLHSWRPPPRPSLQWGQALTRGARPPRDGEGGAATMERHTTTPAYALAETTTTTAPAEPSIADLRRALQLQEGLFDQLAAAQAEARAARAAAAQATAEVNELRTAMAAAEVRLCDHSRVCRESVQARERALQHQHREELAAIQAALDAYDARMGRYVAELQRDLAAERQARQVLEDLLHEQQARTRAGTAAPADAHGHRPTTIYGPLAAWGESMEVASEVTPRPDPRPQAEARQRVEARLRTYAEHRARGGKPPP